MNEEERKIFTAKLREAACPLIKFLNENYDPQTTAIITPTSVEIVQSTNFIPNINEFIVD